MGNYRISPTLSLPPDAVQEYWQRLAQYDLLKDRFLHLRNPQWLDVQKIIATHGTMMFHVTDDETEEIVGDFQLAMAIGRSAQLHFSVHPERRFKTKVDITKEGSRLILANPEITSLVGLTPFRHAKLILKLAGWECRGELKGSVQGIGDRYLDAFIMVYQ